jgi:hypothetical protein
MPAMDYSRPIMPWDRDGPQRIAHTKSGVVVACRLGDVLRPNVVVVAGSEHTHASGRMILTRLALELVEVLPGNVVQVMDRLAGIMVRAEARAAEGLGRACLCVDETRQQTAHALLLEKLTPDRLLLVTTHGRLMDDTPNWKIGRMTLFSELRVLLARPGVLQVLEPATDDPRIWRGSQIRAALASAQERPPKDEPDTYVTDTSTQDDAALAIAAVAHMGEAGAPDPWISNAPLVYSAPDHSR